MRTGRPRQEVVGYSGRHYRQTVDFGPARDYPCVDCGEQAAEWSTVHGTEDFEARCRSCHGLYDGTGQWPRSYSDEARKAIADSNRRRAHA